MKLRNFGGHTRGEISLAKKTVIFLMMCVGGNLMLINLSAG